MRRWHLWRAAVWTRRLEAARAIRRVATTGLWETNKLIFDCEFQRDYHLREAARRM